VSRSVRDASSTGALGERRTGDARDETLCSGPSLYGPVDSATLSAAPRKFLRATTHRGSCLIRALCIVAQNYLGRGHPGPRPLRRAPHSFQTRDSLSHCRLTPSHPAPWQREHFSIESRAFAFPAPLRGLEHHQPALASQTSHLSEAPLRPLPRHQAHVSGLYASRPSVIRSPPVTNHAPG